MKHRTFRLGRAAATLALGAGAIGGVVAAASGVAAALPTYSSVLGSGSSVASTANPTLASTGTAQATGAIQLTLGSGTSVNTGDLITLTASAAGGGTVVFTAGNTPTVTVSPSTGPAASAVVTGEGTSTLTLALTATAGGSPSNAAQTLTVSPLEVDTTGASGAIQVAATYKGQTTASSTPGAYTAAFPNSPATIGTVPAAAVGINVAAESQPTIGTGLTSQPAGNFAVTLSGTAGEAWTAGDYIALAVAPASGSECSGTSYVTFAGTPTVTVASSSNVSSAPTLTPALAFSGTCNSVEPNVLQLKFTNSGTLSTNSGTATIIVSGVTYSTGTTTPGGAVVVSPTYNTSANTLISTPTTTPSDSNAVVATDYVTANNPAVTAAPSSLGTAISPVSVVESQAGTVPTGYVCLTLSSTNVFDTAATPTVKANGGNGAVATSAPVYETVTNTNDTVVFQVTSASTTAPTTYTVSGLSVNTDSTIGAATIAAKDGVSSPTTCGTSGSSVGSATAFTIGTPSNQIYGQTDNGTAAAELEHEFPPGTACPGNSETTTVQANITSPRPVVLATSGNYPDALAGAYLARYLGTGELLTPTAYLASSTLTALRQEGITNVYIVGGPLAVSQADVSQLEATSVYNCGGSAVVDNALGSPVTLSVTQIYGQTLLGTAQKIAEYAPASYVGSAALAGAYAGVNSSSGNGKYNDTSGNASLAPTTTAALPTAILATSQGWQDAESASAMSYAQRFPTLLTDPSALSTQAQSAITSLGIRQVIVMGGPVAISNAVVSTLQGMGVSVLRIAGVDYTDTAAMLANFEVGTTTGFTGLGWDPNHTLTVARGDFYTDGLAGAVVAANGGVAYTAGTQPAIGSQTAPANPTPLVETFSPSTLGNYLPAFLKQAGSAAGIDNQAGTTAGDQITTLQILGGPLAVTPSQIQTMQGDL